MPGATDSEAAISGLLWRGNLYRLAVAPSHRRRGIARALLAEGERRLREKGLLGYERDARVGRFVKTFLAVLAGVVLVG